MVFGRVLLCRRKDIFDDSFGKPVIGETIMMAHAAGFYTNPELGKNQVRLAYVLCKKDLQREHCSFLRKQLRNIIQ